MTLRGLPVARSTVPSLLFRLGGMVMACIAGICSYVVVSSRHAPYGMVLRIMIGDTAWNEAYIMLVSCIDYALDMTCIQSVSQCFIVGGIL